MKKNIWLLAMAVLSMNAVAFADGEEGKEEGTIATAEENAYLSCESQDSEGELDTEEAAVDVS